MVPGSGAVGKWAVGKTPVAASSPPASGFKWFWSRQQQVLNMRKNVAGQVVTAQLIALADGSDVTTGTPTVYVLGDGGTQGAGSGTVAHEGNGCWSYIPTQAETNYAHVAYTFKHAAAITTTVQAYTVAYDPGDAVRLGLTALPNAAPAANGGLPTVDASNRIAGIQGAKNTLDALQDLSQANVRTAVGLASANLDTQLGALAGYVDTEVAAVLAAVDTEVAAIKAKTDNLPASPAATSDIPSAASVADAVWDEALSGHSAAGSAGLALATASSGGVDPSVLADAIWDEALSGHSTAGTAGKKLTDLINTDISTLATAAALATVDTVVDAIKAKTDNLPAAPAATGDAMTLTAAYDAAKTAAATGDAMALTSGERTAVADALLNRDMSAVSDTTARSPLNALRILRNKMSVSGGTLTVTKEDDSTTAWTAAVTGDAAADPIVGVDPA